MVMALLGDILGGGLGAYGYSELMGDLDKQRGEFQQV